jgi:hypothetical protein
MGISVFPSVPKFWDKYTPFDEYAGAVSIAADTTADIYSVTGKGYLSDILAFANNVTHLKLKITIDGTIIHTSELSASSTNPSGVIQLSHLSYSYTGSSIRAYYPFTGFLTEINASLSRHPLVNSAVVGAVTIAQPLFFNESLLIQIENVNVSNTYTYTAVWRGGVI